jgi:hypothetical protein
MVRISFTLHFWVLWSGRRFTVPWVGVLIFGGNDDYIPRTRLNHRLDQIVSPLAALAGFVWSAMR